MCFEFVSLKAILTHSVLSLICKTQLLDGFSLTSTVAHGVANAITASVNEAVEQAFDNLCKTLRVSIRP